jgi:hypothetical protein
MLHNTLYVLAGIVSLIVMTTLVGAILSAIPVGCCFLVGRLLAWWRPSDLHRRRAREAERAERTR